MDVNPRVEVRTHLAQNQSVGQIGQLNPRLLAAHVS